MGGPTTTRQIGVVCRIYKNSSGKVLALDEINVIGTQKRLGINRFFNSASYHTKRLLVHLGVGDRVISRIIMLGDYTSLTEDSGNYNSATWVGTEETNDSIIYFNDLPQLGDTL